MKYYAVIYGEYSEKYINCITTDIRKAVARVLKGGADFYHIEVFDENEVKIDVGNGDAFYVSGVFGKEKVAKIAENNILNIDIRTDVWQDGACVLYRTVVFAPDEARAIEKARKSVVATEQYKDAKKRSEEYAEEVLRHEKMLKLIENARKKSLFLWRVYIKPDGRDGKSASASSVEPIPTSIIIGKEYPNGGYNPNGVFFINGFDQEVYTVDVFAPDAPTAEKIAYDKRTISLAKREGLT